MCIDQYNMTKKIQLHLWIIFIFLLIHGVKTFARHAGPRKYFQEEVQHQQTRINPSSDGNISQTDTTSMEAEIGEVTVTAFRTPYNLQNIPAPVNLITPDRLESGSAITPVEALNRVPGIMMQHGTLNTNRLTIRGIGSRTPYGTNKIKAYFGEIPLTSGDGETTLEDLENYSIKRVEIIKGPSSSLFGAGLGGAILFHPMSVKKDFARYTTTAASFGTYKNTLSAGISGTKSDFFVLGSLLGSDGFRENNRTRRSNVQFHSRHLFSEKSDLQVLFRATEMKAFIPSSVDLNSFLNNPEKAAANWKNAQGYEDYTSGQIGLSFNYLTANQDKFSVAAFGSFRDADELRPFNMLKENSHYLGWRGYVQKNISGEHFLVTLTSGLEYFRETYNWSTHPGETSPVFLSDNHEKRSYENLFLQMESGFSEKFFLSAGINGNLTRFRYTDGVTTNGDQSGQHEYKPVLSPRIGVNYKIPGGIYLFGNLSHGFSTPTFEETLLPEGEINTGIKPESGWNAETGARLLFPGKVQATLSYHHITVTNLLVARRTGEDAYIGVNAGKSLHPGFEAEASWEIIRSEQYPSLLLTGNVTLTHYHFQDFTDMGIDYSGKSLPGTAKNTSLAGFILKPSQNLQFSGWYRHTGKMAVNYANTVFNEPYGLTSLEFRYSGKIKHFSMEIRSGIQNLFDIHYASMLAVNAPAFGGASPRYYYPGEPRNFFVSLSLGVE